MAAAEIEWWRVLSVSYSGAVSVKRPTWVLIGLAIMAVAVGAVLLRGSSADSSDAKGSKTGAGAGAESRSVSPADRPRLAKRATGPTKRGDAGVNLSTASFESENKDTVWAEETRKGLESRLTAIAVKGARVSAIECKSTVCRLRFEGDEHAVAALVDRLIEDESIRSGAATVKLSRDESGVIADVLYPR